MIPKHIAVVCVVIILSSTTSRGDLVTHYNADGNANDSAGFNHGSVFGAGYTTSPMGEAFDFDGTNDYVEAADHSSLDITSNISIAAWVRPESEGASDGTTGILWKGNSIGSASGQSYALLWRGSEVAFRLGEGATLFQTAYVPLQMNAYNHIAGTFDGTQMNLYVDGLVVTTTLTVPTSINNSSGSLLIGSSIQNGGGFPGDPTRFFFDGQIDDVRIYNNALTSSEVASLAVPEPMSASLLLFTGALIALRRSKENGDGSN